MERRALPSPHVVAHGLKLVGGSEACQSSPDDQHPKHGSLGSELGRQCLRLRHGTPGQIVRSLGACRTAGGHHAGTDLALDLGCDAKVDKAIVAEVVVRLGSSGVEPRGHRRQGLIQREPSADVPPPPCQDVVADPQVDPLLGPALKMEARILLFLLCAFAARVPMEGSRSGQGAVWGERAGRGYAPVSMSGVKWSLLAVSASTSCKPRLKGDGPDCKSPRTAPPIRSLACKTLAGFIDFFRACSNSSGGISRPALASLAAALRSWRDRWRPGRPTSGS